MPRHPGVGSAEGANCFNVFLVLALETLTNPQQTQANFKVSQGFWTRNCHIDNQPLSGYEEPGFLRTERLLFFASMFSKFIDGFNMVFKVLNFKHSMRV